MLLFCVLVLTAWFGMAKGACVVFLCPFFSPHRQDRTIAVWDIKSPKDIVLRRVLVGHRAAVNVVDFDDKYIVSASGDRTIKVGLHHCPFVALY